MGCGFNHEYARMKNFDHGLYRDQRSGVEGGD
jgi:hypothetical protein